MTYEALARAADRVAWALRDEGVGPDVPVALLETRAPELLVSLLGVLKAGGAYLPLDPTHPPERLTYRVTQAGANPVLTDLDVASSDGGLAVGRPQDLAYIIYTSGSTGRPKGVMNAHRGVVNRLVWMQAHFGIGADDVVLQKTPFGFDVSVWEFFWPLQQGARLVMARPDGHRDPAYLQDVIEREGVDVAHGWATFTAPGVLEIDGTVIHPRRVVLATGARVAPRELPEQDPAAIVEQIGGLPDAEVTQLFTRPPAVVDRDLAYVRALRRSATKHHDGEPTSVGRDGASDVVSFLRVGVPAVEFGPRGAGHHGPSGRYESWREEAQVLAFALDQMGVADYG